MLIMRIDFWIYKNSLVLKISQKYFQHDLSSLRLDFGSQYCIKLQFKIIYKKLVVFKQVHNVQDKNIVYYSLLRIVN